MRSMLFLLVGLLSNTVFAQYTLDDRIRSHAFFKAMEADSNPARRSILQCYYEPGGNPLQEQLKDTLRASFSDPELFDIARYSKIPFCRIAAFELYSQSDYDEDAVIDFLKRGKIPSSWYTAADSVPETYTPLPTPFLATTAAIRLKMLEILNPGALRREQGNPGDPVTWVPAYPETRPLDLERFVALKTYMSYYCGERLTGVAFRLLKPGEKKPKMPSFYMPYPEMDFGTIDLAYLDPGKTEVVLSGAIKVINNTSQTITVAGIADEPTACLNSGYVIPPKQEVMIVFKSLVPLNTPAIERTVTVKNVKTGGVQTFTFKAKFINTKA